MDKYNMQFYTHFFQNRGGNFFVPDCTNTGHILLNLLYNSLGTSISHLANPNNMFCLTSLMISLTFKFFTELLNSFPQGINCDKHHKYNALASNPIILFTIFPLGPNLNLF